MRAIAVGVALGAVIACGATSGLESARIIVDLHAKGATAMKEADTMIQQNRPDAAVLILRRHVKEVDEVIKKVKKDELINDRHKSKLLQELNTYESAFEESSKRLRAMVDAQYELAQGYQLHRR